MSKIVKAITKPGLGDPLGISGGGGKSKDPRKATGGQRRDIVSEATGAGKRHFQPDKESWSDYISYLEKPAPKPEPAPMEMPSFSFEMPDYSGMFQRPADARSKPAAAKTVAERIKEEASQFANVKAGEKVFSAAQGVSTRLRAAVSQEEDKAGGTTLGESAGTLLGRRGTGGATSFRRKRISRY